MADRTRLGVVTHPGYTDSTYADISACMTRMNTLGVKFMRGLDPDSLALSESWLTQCQTNGIKVYAGTSIFNVPGSTYFDNLESLIADFPGVIVGVEGFNEPDLFFSFATDEQVGEDWAEYALRHQQTLWNGIQARSIDVDVLSPSISSHPATDWTLAQANDVTGYCDMANAHYYTGRDDPTLVGAQAYLDKIRQYAGVMRAAVTETGYANPNSFYDLGQTEEEAATRLQALLDIYFEGGLDEDPERVAVYQLVDLYWNDFEYWGLYYWDWNTKPVVSVVQNFLPPDLPEDPGGGVFVNEPFTAANGTNVDSLTGWEAHPSKTGSFLVQSNRAYASAGSPMLYHTGTPISADYTVETTIRCVTNSAKTGIVGRLDTTAETCYEIFYRLSDTRWRLARKIDGTIFEIGSFTQVLTPGNDYTVALEMVGTTINVYIDGTLRIGVTDTGITAKGKAGIVQATSVSTTSGYHIDSITATDETAGPPADPTIKPMKYKVGGAFSAALPVKRRSAGAFATKDLRRVGDLPPPPPPLRLPTRSRAICRQLPSSIRRCSLALRAGHLRWGL